MENEEVQPEEVQDEVKPMIEDYMERGEDDFDEFADVDGLYPAALIEQLDSLETQMPVTGALQVSWHCKSASLLNLPPPPSAPRWGRGSDPHALHLQNSLAKLLNRLNLSKEHSPGPLHSLSLSPWPRSWGHFVLDFARCCCGWHPNTFCACTDRRGKVFGIASSQEACLVSLQLCTLDCTAHRSLRHLGVA